jgi:hypothetical protein
MFENANRFGDVGILYRFADELPAAKRLDIEVRVLIDGKSAYSEHLAIDPNHQAAPVVELFIANLQLADELIILSADPGHTVTFEMLLDGELIETLAGIDMVATSESLWRQGLLPQDISSRIELPAQASASAKTTCQQCWINFQSCEASNCEPPVPPRLCDLCETALNHCLSTCQDPPCEPWTEYDEDLQTIWWYYTDSAKCYNNWPSGAKVLKEALFHVRIDTYRVTHNCDGSTTRTLVSSRYVTDYCYDDLNQSCSPAVATPWNSCRF